MTDIMQAFDEETDQDLATPHRETFLEKKQKEYAIDDNVEYPDPDYLIEIDPP